MDAARVVGFNWDDGNWPKCGKHGVSRAEIEQAFVNGPAIYAHPAHSMEEQRLRAIGRNDAGRAIYVSFTIRHKADGDYIRPVSAPYMHEKEIARYDERQE